jgi:hypothetical protein
MNHLASRGVRQFDERSQTAGHTQGFIALRPVDGSNDGSYNRPIPLETQVELILVPVRSNPFVQDCPRYAASSPP